MKLSPRFSPLLEVSLASLVAGSLLLACAKPPAMTKGAGRGTSDVGEGTPDELGGGKKPMGPDGKPIPDGIPDPNDPDDPDNPPGTGPLAGFSLSLARLEPMAFKSLLSKLAFLVDADEKTLTTNAAFAELIKNRYNLGDYDYARRSPGNSQWEVTQMNLWMGSLLPYCTSAALKTKYKSDVTAFVKAAISREPSADELKALAANTKLNADAAKKFEGACIAYLTSLEFRNQWAKAAPKRGDYLNTVASTLVQRPLTDAEIAGTDPIPQVVEAMVNSPRFLESSRIFMEQLMRSNGSADGVDFDLPGNLMALIVKNKEPYSNILTANTCVDKNGASIKCDSNAPYTAGVLTTRSFLLNHAGPFNIARSNYLLKTFTCLAYPMSPTLEPPLKIEDMVLPFATTNGKGFGADSGNGTNCYLCHSQFGKHAQLFVKFDRQGLYVADADGLQDMAPNAGAGYTNKLTYVSHFKDAANAESEKSEYFGKPAANLREAALTIAASNQFLDCSIRKVLGHYLRLQDSTTNSIPSDLIAAIRDEVKANAKEPTFQTIVSKALGNETVINSFIKPKE